MSKKAEESDTASRMSLGFKLFGRSKPSTGQGILAQYINPYIKKISIPTKSPGEVWVDLSDWMAISQEQDPENPGVFSGVYVLRSEIPALEGEEESHVFELLSSDIETKDVKSEDTELQSLKRRYKEIELEYERLKTRVSNLQSGQNREIQRYDQLSASLDKLIDHCIEQSKANDTMQAALIARKDGRLCMFEAHEGAVREVYDDEVVVYFEIDDELIEHTYKKKQFIGGRLPDEGDRICVYVHAAVLPDSDEDDDIKSSAKEGKIGETRKPRQFETGPLEF